VTSPPAQGAQGDMSCYSTIPSHEESVRCSAAVVARSSLASKQ
jgi:hypothetical protein